MSGGGAGRAVHRREQCTGVDSREWNATMKRAHTFGLPADRSHQTHQWHVEAIIFPSTLINPPPPDTLKYCPGDLALKYYNFAGPYLTQ